MRPTTAPASVVADSRRQRLVHRCTHRLGAYGATGAVGLSMLLGQCAPQQCAPAPAPPPAPAPIQSPAPSPDMLQQIVDLTNQRRAEHGLPALSINQKINNAAQVHANDLAARDVMSHTGGDGSNAGQRLDNQGYYWTAWGENVATGYSNAAATVEAWMNSPSHRQNILSSVYNEIGVGLAYAADGSSYWVQDFGRL